MGGMRNDIDKLIAVKVAIKKETDTMVFMGFNVGEHITDDEITKVAVAAIKAASDYDKAPSI